MVKKLKLGIYYLSKYHPGFVQTMQVDVVAVVAAGLKSKKAGVCLLFKLCPTSIF
jgi:hypothetical protein